MTMRRFWVIIKCICMVSGVSCSPSNASLSISAATGTSNNLTCCCAPTPPINRIHDAPDLNVIDDLCTYYLWLIPDLFHVINARHLVDKVRITYVMSPASMGQSALGASPKPVASGVPWDELLLVHKPHIVLEHLVFNFDSLKLTRADRDKRF